MTYEEALEYIHGVNPTFCNPGLDRIKYICSELSNPQDKLKFIHIAGTNGKGSVSCMLHSVLRECGLKVGLYTSPYIVEFNERMRVDGVNISNEKLAALTEKIKSIVDKMQDKPTEFEIITAIAFEYFYEEKCDIVVLEVGMGGRLDSTNIISTAVLSIITGIALDHTAYLGDTVPKIAWEKAGIIKKNTPVIFGGEDKDAESVIKSRAEEMGAEYYTTDYSKLRISTADLDGAVLSYKSHLHIRIQLNGLYQPKNTAIVLEAADILKALGYRITQKALRKGLSKAKWPARFEIISHDPLVIFDGAHNPQGIDAAVESIKFYFKDKKIYALTGVLRDKDYNYIASKLSEVISRAVTITPGNPRALKAEEYADVLKSCGVDATSRDGIENALEYAVKIAKEDNTPLICLGSLYTYVDVIRYFEKITKEI